MLFQIALYTCACLYTDQGAFMAFKFGDSLCWNEFQKLFVRKQKLPYGTTLELRHRATDRRARATDKMVTLGAFKGLASDHETLNDLIVNRLTPSLKNPDCIKKYTVHIKGPNEEAPKGKNILVGTIRSWPGQPTPQEIEAQIELEENIEYVSQQLDLRVLDSCHEPDAAARAVMRKMLTQFSSEDLKMALDEEVRRAADQ